MVQNAGLVINFRTGPNYAIFEAVAVAQGYFVLGC